MFSTQRVISSRDGDGAYFLNLAIIKKGVRDGNIEFIHEGKLEKCKIYHQVHGRDYDFARSARSKIGDDVTKYLTNYLPGIDEETQQEIRSSFENLFNYYKFKKWFDRKGVGFKEDLKLLIEKTALFGTDYVGHIEFECETIKDPDVFWKVTSSGPTYTVYARIICHGLTWFRFQRPPLKSIVGALIAGSK